MRNGFVIGCGLVLSLAIGSLAFAQEARASDGSNRQEDTSLSLKSGLLLAPQGEPGERGPREFGPSGVENLLRGKLVDGTLSQFAPQEGQTLEGQDRLGWKTVEFNAEGIVDERGSCLYVPVNSDVQKVVVLHAAGHTESYVNGEPRGGDVYNAGFMHLPILGHRRDCRGRRHFVPAERFCFDPGCAETPDGQRGAAGRPRGQGPAAGARDVHGRAVCGRSRQRLLEATERLNLRR